MRRFGGGERRRGERRYLISWWLKTNKLFSFVQSTLTKPPK
tara:strand:- start:343 stop:465 length:123 start_codon:yes stop_codon:yes gene_type:complete